MVGKIGAENNNNKKPNKNRGLAPAFQNTPDKNNKKSNTNETNRNLRPVQNNGETTQKVILKPVNERKSTALAEFAAKNEIKKEIEIVRIKSGVDRPFLIIMILLLCFGTVMVFSASYAYAAEKYNDSYYFFIKQLQWIVVGTVGLIIFARIDYTLIKKWTPVFFGAVMVLVVLTPFIGTVKNGARRWIMIGGISIQASELMKLALVLIFAWYAVKMKEKMKTFRWGLLVPFLLIGVIALTMVMQKHISGMIILALISIAMIYIGGAPWGYLAGGGVLMGAAMAAVIFFTDHAKQRIDIWLNPENYPRTGGWQTIQSLYAITQGGFFGVGLGKSTQKNLYLPEPQNDFIFSIVCEELGFIGAFCVIALFVMFIVRGITIARRTPDKFASLVVLGITVKVGLQALLNIAVVTNSIPNTGISLPFFSYGGTSLVWLMIEMGIILSISRFSYLEKG